MSAFRLSKVDADGAIAAILKFRGFLFLIFIVQIIVAIYSFVFFEGIITPLVALLYILMWTGGLVALGMSAKSVDAPQKPVYTEPQSWTSRLLLYMTFFIGGWAVFLLLAGSGVIAAGTVFAPYAFGLFIYHCVLVSPSESIFFHGILRVAARKFIKDNPHPLIKKFDYIIVYGFTQTLFALAHFAVYSQYTDYGALLGASFAFGCVFLWLAERYGLAAAMGLHSAWNWVMVSGGGVTSMAIGSWYVLLAIGAVVVSLAMVRVLSKFNILKSVNRKVEVSV